MRATIGRLSGLLLGTAILLAGQGLLLFLVPMTMNAAGFSPRAIGFVVSAYFAGLGAGAWLGVHLIRTVGHIRAYGGLIAIMIAAALLLPLLFSLPGWIGLRFVHGFAAAGVFLAIETWLNSVAASGNRARVLGLYMIITLSGLGAAPFLANLYTIDALELFMISGIFLALSIVPVVLSRAQAPHLESSGLVRNTSIYKRSPLAFAGALAAGLTAGAFWALAPLFGVALGLNLAGVTGLVGAAVLGGMLLQWPIGYLSDRADRRRVLFSLAVAGIGASLVIIVFGVTTPVLLYGGLTVFGGVVFALYPLSVSHAADQAEDSEQLLKISRALLLVSGFGYAIGPLAAAEVQGLTGKYGLFAFALLVFGGLAVFALWRASHGRRIPAAGKEKYMPLEILTPAGATLDPRIEAAKESE